MWLETSDEADRIRTNAPRVTTQLLGLDLIQEFLLRLPGLRQGRIMHMFDDLRGHIGCRPKVATWAHRGEDCKNCYK